MTEPQRPPLMGGIAFGPQVSGAPPAPPKAVVSGVISTEDFFTMRSQRDRLAMDALAALAGAGVCTPVEGFVKAPHELKNCIEDLVRQRDNARQSWLGRLLKKVTG